MALVNRFEKFLCRLFEHRVIVNCDRDPYLYRWYIIRRKHFALFLHKFIRSDEDRALHDHPWNFIVIPIWRGYIEHSAPDMIDIKGDQLSKAPFVSQGALRDMTPVTRRRRVLPIIGTRFRRGTYRHRVELIREQRSQVIDKSPGSIETLHTSVELPSWSLFIRFKEFRTWGFHMPEGWIEWNKFWQEKCE